MHCGWSNPLACTWCQPAPPRSARSGAPTPWLTQYMDTRYGGGSCADGQERQGWMEAALRFFLISGSTAGACCSVNMLSHETRPEGNQQQTLWNPHIHRPLRNPPPRSTTTALNTLDTSRFHRRRRVNNNSDVAGYLLRGTLPSRLQVMRRGLTGRAHVQSLFLRLNTSQQRHFYVSAADNERCKTLLCAANCTCIRKR